MKKHVEKKHKKVDSIFKKLFADHRVVGIGILFILFCAIAIFAVPIPYTAVENYTEKEPYIVKETYIDQESYEATETYTEKEPYEKQVPYTIKEPYETTETYYEKEAYTDTECSEQEANLQPQLVCNDATWYSDAHLEYTVTNPDSEAKGYVEVYVGFVLQSGGTTGTSKRQYLNPGGSATFTYDSNEYTSGCSPTRILSNDVAKTVCQQVTKYRDVPKTRTVTKYRDVTKYNTVTAYRDVEKTRPIMKYKDVEKTRDVTKYKETLKTRTVTKYATLFQRWTGKLITTNKSETKIEEGSVAECLYYENNNWRAAGILCNSTDYCYEYSKSVKIIQDYSKMEMKCVPTSFEKVIKNGNFLNCNTNDDCLTQLGVSFDDAILSLEEQKWVNSIKSLIRCKENMCESTKMINKEVMGS